MQFDLMLPAWIPFTRKSNLQNHFFLYTSVPVKPGATDSIRDVSVNIQLRLLYEKKDKSESSFFWCNNLSISFPELVCGSLLEIQFPPIFLLSYSQCVTSILWYQMATLAPINMSFFQLARRRKVARVGILLYFRSIVWKFQTSIPLSYHWPELRHMTTPSCKENWEMCHGECNIGGQLALSAQRTRQKYRPVKSAGYKGICIFCVGGRA